MLLGTLGQKSTFYPKTHIFKISFLGTNFFAKFTFFKSQNKRNFQTRNGVLHQCDKGRASSSRIFHSEGADRGSTTLFENVVSTFVDFHL